MYKNPSWSQERSRLLTPHHLSVWVLNRFQNWGLVPSLAFEVLMHPFHLMVYFCPDFFSWFSQRRIWLCFSLLLLNKTAFCHATEKGCSGLHDFLNQYTGANLNGSERSAGRHGNVYADKIHTFLASFCFSVQNCRLTDKIGDGQGVEPTKIIRQFDEMLAKHAMIPAAFFNKDDVFKNKLIQVVFSHIATCLTLVCGA